MATTTNPRATREHGTVDMPVLLARWRARELRLARTFRECAGAGAAEIEELYDATVLALLPRRYESEEHLRAALRKGIKMRALRLHRDRAAHEQALAHAAPVIHAAERARAFEQEPERALLAQEDDMIVGEFLSELTALERRVFVLMADERSWRAIGTALGLAENEARNATRSCERKRELFLKLYGTGRLCGYRSRTIAALLAGELTSELALEQAQAHLRHCRACQARHQATNEQLRAAFERRALAVLPVPVLLGAHTGLLDRVQGLLEYPARVVERLAGSGPGAGVRERFAEAAAGAAGATKVAVGIVGVAALAGGALDAAHVLDSASAHHAHDTPRAAVAPPATVSTAGTLLPVAQRQTFRRLPLRGARPARHFAYPAGRSLPFGPGHVVPATHPAPARRSSAQHEPGGFAYLGASTEDAAPVPGARRAQAVSQHAGGAFSP